MGVPARRKGVRWKIQPLSAGFIERTANAANAVVFAPGRKMSKDPMQQ